LDWDAVIGPEPENPLMQAALDYAARGYPVFPCNRDKTPATEHGFKDATRDQQTIRQWWSVQPDAMIGVPTGAVSGIVVVDLDTDPAAGTDGPAAFTALIRSEGSPIRTRKHRTPRGGCHLLFAHPGTPVKNSAGALASGVDIRGDGGYIIMPPSSNGTGVYNVETDRQPGPIPPWLCRVFHRHGIMTPPPEERLQEPTRNTQPVQDKSGRRPGIPPSVATLIAAGVAEGRRNDCALAIAVQLRDEGHDQVSVNHLVLAFACKCRPPLPEEEALRCVASAFTKPPREPARDPGRKPERRGTTAHYVTELSPEAPDPWEPAAPLGGLSEPPPEWPWDALPTALREMGQGIEQTFDVSAEMAGGAVIGVASIALGNKARVELKRDHHQFGNLCLMVVADVAAGKTPVMRAAQAPLVAWQHERREEWEREYKEWEAARLVAEARIHGLEEQARRAGAGKTENVDPEALRREIVRLRDEIGDRPPEPTLFCADATGEALGRRMQEMGGAIGVLSGEARKILSIAKGRYVEGGDIDLWLAGHAGDYVRVDRSSKDKPSYEIPDACLSAAIMTQPDALQSLGDSEPLRESGFLARWLYVIPDHVRGAYPVESVPAHIAARYAETIRALIDLPLPASAEGTRATHLIHLHPAAFERWRAYHDGTLREIGEARQTKPGGYLQCLSKLPEHVARLALLFHAVHHVEGARLGQITSEVDDAIRLAEALKVHARRAFALIGADADTARARKAWAWLDRNRARLRSYREKEGLPAIEAVKPRDVDRNEVAGVTNAAEADAVLMLLMDKGYLQAVDLQMATGKLQRLYYLRPPALPKGPTPDVPPPDKPDKPDIPPSVGFVGCPTASSAPLDPDYEDWLAGGPGQTK